MIKTKEAEASFFVSGTLMPICHGCRQIGVVLRISDDFHHELNAVAEGSRDSHIDLACAA